METAANEEALTGTNRDGEGASERAEHGIHKKVWERPFEEIAYGNRSQ